MKIDNVEVVATPTGWADAKTGEIVQVIYGLPGARPFGAVSGESRTDSKVKSKKAKASKSE